MYGQNPYSQYPYGGYNYQTYGQRPYMQQQQPQMGQPQQNAPTICYAKMEEAKPFIITAPNSAMLFIDREKHKALLKMTDNVCNSFSRYFDISETDENGSPLQQQADNPTIDYSQFVTQKQLETLPTVEQYNQLLEQHNSLVEQFKAMQKIIAGGKSNGNGTNGAKGN